MLLYMLVVVCVASSLAEEQENLANNPHPSSGSSGCDSFLFKHVNRNAPTTLNQAQWQNFIKNVIRTCDRPVQSFLPYAQKQQVLNVCSPSGGRVYSGDQCISTTQFSITKVYVDNNCVVTNVIPETKYIILACQKIKGSFCPVHFEPNPRNTGPAGYNQNCAAPRPLEYVGFRQSLHALGLHALGLHALGLPALGLLILILLSVVLICCKCFPKSKEKKA